MKIQRRGQSAVLSAAIGVILGSPAWAAAPVQLEEIVVTAQRAETNLQQTPISVAAISAETLTERGASNLMDLTHFTPNLQVGSAGLNGNGGRFAIRGIGQDAGTSASVGLYVDEVYYASGSGNMMGLFDVDRIEILRGPQGTLFGRNTIGGAVQYVTVKPGKDFGGYVEATGGNFNRTDIEGALTIPLGDTVSTRVSAGYNKRDGFVHDLLTGDDRGEDERKFGRLQVRWTPAASLTVDLKAEMLTLETNGRASTIHGYPGGVFPLGVNDGAQFPVLARLGAPFNASNTVPTTEHYDASDVSPGEYTMTGYNAPDWTDLEYTAGAAVISWELSDAVALKSITGYNRTSNESATDTDSSNNAFLRGGGGPANVLDVFSQELQLRLNLFSGRLNWTTGLFYYDESSETPSGRTAFGFTPLLVSDGNVTNVQSQAIFTQATFNFTDRLSGTVGLRYSEEDRDSQSIDATPPIGPTPKFEGTFEDTSPHVGVKYQATDDFMIYGSASKGFRAGGFGTNTGFTGGIKPFDPEIAWTYELGLRMEFMDRRLRVNPTVFFTDWTDIQVNTLVTTPEPGAICSPCTPGVGTVPQNIGDAEIKGFEVEALFQVTDRLSLQASFGYLDAGYTEVQPVRGQVYPYGFLPPSPPNGGAYFVPNLCDGNNDPTLAALNPTRTPAQLAPLVPLYECKGASDMKQAPEIKYSLGARYSIPLSSGASVVTNVDYGWTDDMRSQVANLDYVPMPSYGILNARVQYNAPDNRWSLAVFGTNLTDEYYYNGGTDYAAGYTPGATVWDPARPAEYGATLKFNF